MDNAGEVKESVYILDGIKQFQDEIDKLRADLATCVSALEKINESDRIRGYPTGSEWLTIIGLVHITLAKVGK